MCNFQLIYANNYCFNKFKRFKLFYVDTFCKKVQNNIRICNLVR